MTPKEKAQELYSLYEKGEQNYQWWERSKQFAIMIVDEIIKSWEEDGNKRLDVGIIKYWQEVKTEIENL